MAAAHCFCWLFVWRAIAGLCGSSYVIANAYIAAVTLPEDRAKAYGMVVAAFGVGFVLGPAIDGLLGEFGPRVPLYAAAAISVLNFMYGWFVLPKTLTRANMRPFDWRRAHAFGTFAIFRRYAGVPPWCGVLFTILRPEGFVHPMLMTILSKAVPEGPQGELQGGISSVMNIALLGGTVFFSQIFGWFLRPDAIVISADIAFYVAAVIIAMSWVMFMMFVRIPNVR